MWFFICFSSGWALTIYLVAVANRLATEFYLPNMPIYGMLSLTKHMKLCRIYSLRLMMVVGVNQLLPFTVSGMYPINLSHSVHMPQQRITGTFTFPKYIQASFFSFLQLCHAYSCLIIKKIIIMIKLCSDLFLWLLPCAPLPPLPYSHGKPVKHLPHSALVESLAPLPSFLPVMILVVVNFTIYRANMAQLLEYWIRGLKRWVECLW